MIAPCSIRLQTRSFSRRDQVLHIGLRTIGARERGVQFGDAAGGKGLQLVRIEIILIGMATAEKQHRGAKACAPGFQRGALLQEAAEWRQPRAGTDHDDRHGGIVGQPEPGLGFAHRRMDGLACATAGEIVRADALVDAATRTRGSLDHGDGDAAARGIDRGRRRDRIIARREQRQHFEIGMERQFAGRMFLQQIEHRFALCQNFRAIALGGRGIVADIGQQFRLGHRTAGVLRHDLDLLAGRDLLQFDEIGQQPSDRYGSPTGSCARRPSATCRRI